MRVVIQRVTRASVSVDGALVSSIQRGVLCLVGITHEDTDVDIEYCAGKILKLRLHPDGDKEWARSVVDIEGEVLSVSQFTLHAQVQKNKPSFHAAAGTEPARAIYQRFLDRLRAQYQADRIKDGRFAAMMQVELVNDGPVTIIVDSKDSPAANQSDAAKAKAERRAEAEARTARNAAAKEAQQEAVGYA